MNIKTGMAFILSTFLLLGNSAAFCTAADGVPVQKSASASENRPVTVITAVSDNTAYQQTIIAEIVREKGSETKVINGQMLVLDEEGCIYGPADETAPLEVIKDIEITADNVVLEDVIINGNLFIYADNVVLNRLIIKGTMYISQGKALKLDQITLENIKVMVPDEPEPAQLQDERDWLDTLPEEGEPSDPAALSAEGGLSEPVTGAAYEADTYVAQEQAAAYPHAAIDTPIILDAPTQRHITAETTQYQIASSTQSTPDPQTAPGRQAVPVSVQPQDLSQAPDTTKAPQPSGKSNAIRAYLRAASVNDADSLIVVVNKKRSLPASWKPDDLVKLQVPYRGRAEARYLRKEAADALTELFAAAKNEGIELYAVSGYRSYNLQNTVFNKYSNMMGVISAQRVSARPGQSEHQTGLAVDISTRAMSYNLYEAFGRTREGIWLEENAATYGFVLRYPKGSEAVTGYSYEPWHFRYVGEEIAADVADKGLTLEEYFSLFEDELS